MATYKIKDVPGFESLLAVGEFRQFGGTGEAFRLFEVAQFVNTSVVIGDRELKFSVPEQAIWINPKNLVEIDPNEADREYASDNPYGAFKYEGRFTKGNLTITHSVFDQAVSITIYETSKIAEDATNFKTLYTASFFTNRVAALELVEAMLHNNLDPEDLIFELQKLKESDYNG